MISDRSSFIGEEVDEIEEFTSEDISDTSSVLSFKAKMKRIIGMVSENEEENIMMTDSSMLEEESYECTKKFSLAPKA